MPRATHIQPTATPELIADCRLTIADILPKNILSSIGNGVGKIYSLIVVVGIPLITYIKKGAA